jgi:hypothetical protein
MDPMTLFGIGLAVVVLTSAYFFMRLGKQEGWLHKLM